jgi:hypothetical protein
MTQGSTKQKRNDLKKISTIQATLTFKLSCNVDLLPNEHEWTGRPAVNLQ